MADTNQLRRIADLLLHLSDEIDSGGAEWVAGSCAATLLAAESNVDRILQEGPIGAGPGDVFLIQSHLKIQVTTRKPKEESNHVH